jgi:Pyridoxamine 5'-phosphate oxidase
MRWNEFSAASPQLAAVAKEWIVDRHIMLLGTLRPDGSPRISAVECDFVGDDLCTGMIWQSTKALDLLRDPRMTAHSLPAGLSNPDGDFKLYGRAVSIEGELKKRYGDVLYARIQWRPSEPYHCFSFDITAAGFVKFRGQGRDAWSWRAGGDLRKDFRPDVA